MITKNTFIHARTTSAALRPAEDDTPTLSKFPITWSVSGDDYLDAFRRKKTWIMWWPRGNHPGRPPPPLKSGPESYTDPPSPGNALRIVQENAK
jgi:hypothetical protein